MSSSSTSTRSKSKRRAYSPGASMETPVKGTTPSFDPLVYFPVGLALMVLVIGSLYDARAEVAMKPPYFPPPLDFSARAFKMVTSPIVIALWACIFYGIKLERDAAAHFNLDRRERFAMIWALCNACWFHTGADVFSGLFEIMPNLTEAYKILNKDHHLPMHHPDRVVMDVIYWFELLIETPLALFVFYLFLKRRPSRYVVESYLHGLHVGGYVGYYIPDMVVGHTTHPLISNLDRCIAFTWVVIPHFLVWDCYRRAELTKKRA